MSIEVTSNFDTKAQAAPVTVTESAEVKEKAISAAAVNTEAETTETSEISEKSEDAESPDQDVDADSEEQEGEKVKKKSGNGFKKRVDKLNQKLSAKDQEIAFLREQLTKTKAEPEVKPEVQSAEGRPKADDYETAEAFYEALADWKVEQKLEAKAAESKADSLKSEKEKIVSEHMSRVEAFKAKHDDFDDLLDEVDDIPMSIAVQELLLKSENGPELMYQLAKNREEYERICKLPPLQAAKAMGTFEAKFTKAIDAPKEIKTSNAPKPINPIGGKTVTAVKKSIFDPNLSQADYEKLRREQRSASRSF